MAVLLEVSLRTDPLVAAEDLKMFRDFIAYNYNACQPSVAVGLTRLFAVTEFKSVAEALQFPANATPTQLSLQQWLGLFAFAMQKRPLLEKLVGGQEKAVEQRHSKRTKLHRTRYDNR
jgi:hypothetical protein